MFLILIRPILVNAATTLASSLMIKCPEDTHHSFSMLHCLNSADENNGIRINVLFSRGSDNMHPDQRLFRTLPTTNRLPTTAPCQPRHRHRICSPSMKRRWPQQRKETPLAVSLHEILRPLAMPRRCTSILLPALLY